MIIALNLVLATLVGVGIVGLVLHAIHSEHKERTLAARPRRGVATETHRFADHRRAATRTADATA